MWFLRKHTFRAAKTNCVGISAIAKMATVLKVLAILTVIQLSRSQSINFSDKSSFLREISAISKKLPKHLTDIDYCSGNTKDAEAFIRMYNTLVEPIASDSARAEFNFQCDMTEANQVRL